MDKAVMDIGIEKNMLCIYLCMICVLPLFTYAQEERPCRGGVYDLVDPFMGNWKEFTVSQEGEVFEGNLKSSKSPNGCTITQRFVSADLSFSYQSFGYVEGSTGLWKEIYVFNNGNHAEYQWFAEGSDIIMRRTGGSRLLDRLHQLRLTKISSTSYDVIEEHSYDNGQSWVEKELTRIKKD